MAVPGFFPQQVYGNAPVVDLQVYCPTIGAGLPTSISRFTLSAWTCGNGFIFNVNRRVGVGTPAAFQVLLQASAPHPYAGPQTPLVRIFATNNAGTALINLMTFVGPGPVQEVPFYDQTAGGVEYISATGVHTLISVDLIAHTVQVYCNDTPMVLDSGSWGASAAVENTATYWQLEASLGSIGDVWFVPSAIDLSVTANRRQFINADLSAVPLPSNGAVTVGGTPAIFLHAVSTGAPSGFYANNGTALAWALDPISTAASFPPLLNPAGTSPCMDVIGGTTTPPPTEKLALDNVIVTASTTLLDKNLISLRWSDDRGHSWGSWVTQSMGEAGEYRTSLQWQRLAYARDRVFEISWSVPCRTALQGAWIDVTPAQS